MALAPPPSRLAALRAAAAAAVGRVDRAVLGLYCQLVSTLFISLMALVAKLAGRMHPPIPPFELVLSRSLILVAVSSLMLARQGPQAQWPWRSARRGLLLLRGCFGFGAISSLYLAVQYLPLSDTAVLNFLAPVFVAAAAPLILGESAGKGVLLAMPLCVVGVVLVAQPTFLFGSGAQALSAVGVALGIGQAASSASAKLCIRSLGSTEPVASIILSMGLVSSLGGALACALLPGHWTTPAGAAAWGVLLSVGALGCGVQVLATLALKLSRAAAVTSMQYFQVVWGLLADLAIFHDPPNGLSLLGALLVCLSSFIIVNYEKRGAAEAAGAAARGARRPGPKAKDSSRALDGAAASHAWQQLQHEDDEAAATGDGRLLELAESGLQAGGGHPAGAAVRWATAADEVSTDAALPAASKQHQGVAFDAKDVPNERAPLVGTAAEQRM